MLLRYCFWRRPFTRSFQWRQVRRCLSCVDGEIEFCAAEYQMNLPRENKSRLLLCSILRRWSMSLLPALWSVSPLRNRQSPSFHSSQSMHTLLSPLWWVSFESPKCPLERTRINLLKNILLYCTGDSERQGICPRHLHFILSTGLIYGVDYTEVFLLVFGSQSMIYESSRKIEFGL